MIISGVPIMEQYIRGDILNSSIQRERGRCRCRSGKRGKCHGNEAHDAELDGCELHFADLVGADL